VIASYNYRKTKIPGIEPPEITLFLFSEQAEIFPPLRGRIVITYCPVNHVQRGREGFLWLADSNVSRFPYYSKQSVYFRYVQAILVPSRSIMTQVSNHNIVLDLKGLTKSYGDLVAVRDLSLEVSAGEIFGLLGPNGAGKTTTINIICGLLKPDAGEVRLNDIPLKNVTRERRRMIGLCPQDLIIWEQLTCLEQLEFVGQQYDLTRRVARERALKILELLGLPEKRNKLAKTLSGGMKRRLNIALALVHSPDILILDEPQAGLDPQSRVLVREYIRSLAGKMTVILTTHDMDEADRLSDRIAIIDHGELLVLDTSDNLKNSIGTGDVLELKVSEGEDVEIERLKEALPGDLRNLSYQQGLLRFLGVNIREALPVLLEQLQQLALEVEDITLRKKTLEDVFIALTGRGLRE
jgi:ABC-2 type transport system ATP-binding protein